MNDVLTQTHTPGVGADGDTKLGGHQQDCEDLTHTGEPDGVNLAHIDSFRLEKLLENHPVMCMFTSCHTNTVRFESLPDGSMTQDIVRSSGFLDEPNG